jgi:hypothetical protein
MNNIKVRTILDKIQETCNVKLIKQFSHYKKEKIPLLQCTKHDRNIITYDTPIIKINHAKVINGRYPLDGDGNLWVGGLYYHQDQIEQSEGFFTPISASSIRNLLMDKEHINPKEYSKAVLIGSRKNFGHFLFEFLPKVFIANQYLDRDFLYLFPEDTPSRFLDYLPLLGINLDKVIKYKPNETFIAEELVIPSVAAHRHPRIRTLSIDEKLYIAMIYTLTSRIKINQIQQSDTGNECLFISRKNERWRRILNEEDLVNTISKRYSIKVIDPRNYSAFEQISIYNSSNLIISPLGGASPSVMFCRPKTKVIELTTPLINGDWGHRVWSLILNLNYIRLDGFYTEACINYGNLPIDRDFFIDPALVVSQVGINN